jgi:DHA1 family bicyclomycin/chloramphenicol resistance-like MFS transporter
MNAPLHTPTYAKGHTPWSLVLLLGALTAFGAVSIDLYLPALPAMGRDLHASASQAQASLSSFFAGMAIGQFIYGPASDRRGRRTPMLVGIGIYLFASVLCALSVSPGMLIGARFVQALGACAGGLIARAVVRDHFDHQDTARVLSLLTLVMGVTPMVAPMIGAMILGLGWRANFWVMTAFGVVLAVWTILGLKESRHEDHQRLARTETPFAAYRALGLNPRLIGYVLTGSLNGAALFTYIAASPDLIIGTYGFPAKSFGLVFAINAAGLIGCSQVNRYLLQKHTTDQVLSVASKAGALVAVALAIAAFTGWGGAWTVLPCVFAALSTYGFMQANTVAGALSIDPHRAGAISAILGAGSFGAGALVSGVAGLLHDGTARPLAGAVLVSMLASSAALHGLAHRRARS